MLWKTIGKASVRTFLLTTLLCGGAQAAIGQEAGNATSGSSNSIWKDTATGLLWTLNDSGGNVNWNQARDYCTGLRLGDRSDWRLPTVDELEALFDRSVSKPLKIKGPIQLGGSCALSSTQNNSGEAWSFCFTYGGRSLGPVTGHGSAGRALCVSGPSK